MKKSINNSILWQQLQEHYNSIKDIHMRKLFADDNMRYANMSLHFEDILLDYSKNRITDETMGLLLNLAQEHGLKQAIDDMFTGKLINISENRAVLHTALRYQGDSIVFDGENIMPKINNELDKMQALSKKIRSGEWLGYTGKQITDVVNIGIGGSHLGLKMLCSALNPYIHKRLNAHFISGIDSMQFLQSISKLNPETTIFIVSSKSFVTQETMTNADSAKEWFLQYNNDKKNIAKHFFAISVNTPAAIDFGISSNNIFKCWNWVGGRYSLWSSVSLIVVIMIGIDRFKEFLQGGAMMDEHFKNSPFDKNMPVILAMVGVWYNNFFNTESQAILPYGNQLLDFPSFLQQLDMESNGKSVSNYGEDLSINSGPIVWGNEGINGQHSFYQLLHQGTRIIPIDFIASTSSSKGSSKQHDIMMSNFFAQSQALCQGRNTDETIKLLKDSGKTDSEIKKLSPHMTFNGNNPSNSLLLKEISPKSIGTLIALYEHKVFVQGVIFGVNSFDQYGVELGKELALNILQNFQTEENINSHDSSTNGLINHYNSSKQ